MKMESLVENRPLLAIFEVILIWMLLALKVENYRMTQNTACHPNSKGPGVRVTR